MPTNSSREMKDYVLRELTLDELEKVSGGNIWAIVLGAAAAIGAIRGWQSARADHWSGIDNYQELGLY